MSSCMMCLLPLSFLCTWEVGSSAPLSIEDFPDGGTLAEALFQTFVDGITSGDHPNVFKPYLYLDAIGNYKDEYLNPKLVIFNQVLGAVSGIVLQGSSPCETLSDLAIDFSNDTYWEKRSKKDQARQDVRFKKLCTELDRRAAHVLLRLASPGLQGSQLGSASSRRLVENAAKMILENTDAAVEDAPTVDPQEAVKIATHVAAQAKMKAAQAENGEQWAGTGSFDPSIAGPLAWLMFIFAVGPMKGAYLVYKWCECEIQLRKQRVHVSQCGGTKKAVISLQGGIVEIVDIQFTDNNGKFVRKEKYC